MSNYPRIKESALYRAAYFLVSLSVLLVDQWTKGIITRAFDVHQSRTIIGGTMIGGNGQLCWERLGA